MKFYWILLLHSMLFLVRSISIPPEENLQNKAKMKRTTLMNDANQPDDYKMGVDKNHITPTIFTRYLSSLVPIVKGDHVFNSEGDQEWRIESNSDVKFAVYGEKLDGGQISFTTHRESCQWERKEKSYPLKVEQSSTDDAKIERALITLNLPSYNSTLYICFTPANSNQVFHQGDWPTLKIRVHTRPLPIWATILCLVVLLSLSGLFSGLNLGLMSLTPDDLIVIQEAGNENDRKYAKKIYPVRKHGNFLLCTILLGNVLVNSTTTILLDTLISGGLAVAGATLAIVIFGEIIPQAICSRHGLEVGSRTIFLTRMFMIATFVVAFPLSKLLDFVLGEEVGARYTRDQMRALLKHTKTTDIEDREKAIMTGVLGLKAKKIRDVMTNLVDVFMLDADRIVDDELVLNVYGYGYSRIPVYEGQRDNIVGLVNARDFALPDTDSGKFTVRNIMNFCKHRYGSSITPDDSSYDVFNLFKREQYHFGVVVEYDNTGDKDPKARAVGVVTLEDIIEEMIQEEIVDETDVFTDNRRKVRNALFHAPDFSAFLRSTDNESTSKVSAQMKVAVFQFLSTSVEPFKEKYISAEILTRLLNIDLYKDYEFDEEASKSGKQNYIYEYGKSADFFVLIVSGNAELETGKEKIISEIGSFHYFGVSALYNPLETVEDLIRSKTNKFRPFIPDFSLRVSEDLQILRIRRVYWLAAVRATFAERKQIANGGTATSNADGEQIDLLSKELEIAEQVEPMNSFLSSNQTFGRERTASLAANFPVQTEKEKLLEKNRTGKNLSNSTRFLIETPIQSSKNTPVLNEKQRSRFLRLKRETPSSPSLLSPDSSNSKHRSLT